MRTCDVVGTDSWVVLALLLSVIRMGCVTKGPVLFSEGGAIGTSHRDRWERVSARAPLSELRLAVSGAFCASSWRMRGSCGGG